MTKAPLLGSDRRSSGLAEAGAPAACDRRIEPREDEEAVGLGAAVRSGRCPIAAGGADVDEPGGTTTAWWAAVEPV
jgi:hypothetical protein